MLLLVLILVLIAFGLLLVGFLSSSVLWAWVSVAVSVGAAGVLLFDTLQRRSVVRAGDGAGAEPPVDVAAERTVSAAAPARPAFGTADGGRGDIDPVTEVIPVIRPAAFQAPAVDPRFDPDADAQQTVMMPAVQPPGSPAGPSGATPGQTPSSESSSPSVTISKGEPRVPDAPVVGDPSTVVVRAAGPDAPSGSAATTSTPGDPGPVDAPSAPASDPGSGEGASTAAGGAAALLGAAGAAAASRPVDTPATDSGRPTGADDVEATTAVAPPPLDERVTTSSAPPAEAAGSLFTSRPDTNGTSQPAGPDPAAMAPTRAASEPVFGPPVQAADPSAAEAPVADVPEVDGEAPEEQSDPQAAAVVAGLEDEVLVIDEQPRYHVTGCRALAAVSLIPLPVREAVELGFTPCGWCSPDHTLASRHRATAR